MTVRTTAHYHDLDSSCLEAVTEISTTLDGPPLVQMPQPGALLRPRPRWPFRRALPARQARRVSRVTLTGAALAASYDPYPGDVDRYLKAISRRNNAHVAFREAEAALTAVRLRGVVDLAPWIGALNVAQHEYEWAQRDLIRARVVFQADTATCRFCHRREPIVRGTYTRIQFADGISLVCDTCSDRAD